jgi:hypothetical protein
VLAPKSLGAPGNEIRGNTRVSHESGQKNGGRREVTATAGEDCKRYAVFKFSSAARIKIGWRRKYCSTCEYRCTSMVTGLGKQTDGGARLARIVHDRRSIVFAQTMYGGLGDAV